MTYTLDHVLTLSNEELFAFVERAHPLELDAVAGHAYTGIDLSMPAWFHRWMWKSFRKTFYRDPTTGVVRGWNVKVEQVGWDTPPPPKRDRHGAPLSFGHYEVRSTAGQSFPRGWSGSQYLDYREAGNPFYAFPANRGFCPLVAINPGDMELLLGWEVFHLGVAVPLNDFWVLRREGPLEGDAILPRPDDVAARGG